MSRFRHVVKSKLIASGARQAATAQVAPGDPGLLTLNQFLDKQNPEGTRHPSEAYDFDLERMNHNYSAHELGQSGDRRFTYTQHQKGVTVEENGKLVAVSDGHTLWVKHPLQDVPRRYYGNAAREGADVELGRPVQVKYPSEFLGKVYDPSEATKKDYPVLVQNVGPYQVRARKDPSTAKGVGLALVHNGLIVGIADDEWGATLISVAQEYRGRGLGPILRKLWGHFNPSYTSGGYTSAGKAMAIRVWSDRVRELMSHGVYSDLVAKGEMTRDQVEAILAGLQERSPSGVPTAPEGAPKGTGKMLLYLDGPAFVVYDSAFLQNQDPSFIKAHGFMRDSPHVGTFFYALDYEPAFREAANTIAFQMARNERVPLYMGKGYADLLEPGDLPVKRDGDYLSLTQDVADLPSLAAREKAVRRKEDPQGEALNLLLEEANAKDWGAPAPLGVRGSLETPVVGLNVNDGQMPWTDLILSGEKTIETRNSPSLSPHVGERVGVIRTGVGPATLVGYCVLGEPKVYRTNDEFRADNAKHRIPAGPEWDLQPGEVKYGYPITQVERCQPVRVESQGRVWRKLAANWGLKTRVYHGTSIDAWDETSAETVTDLYLTSSKDEAWDFAFEAAASSWGAYMCAHGLTDEDEIPADARNARRAVVVTTTLGELQGLEWLPDDAGGAHNFKRWQESMDSYQTMKVRGNVQAVKGRFRVIEQEGLKLAAQDITETPQFKSWFAGSKAVDAQGKPRRFFHGTSSVFDTFQAGSMRGGLIFFTPDPEEASAYADKDPGWYDEEDEPDLGSPNVIPVYLKVMNPFDPDNPAHRALLGERLGKPEVVEKNLGPRHYTTHPPNYEFIELWGKAIRACGFDGAWVRESEDLGDHNRDLAVFSPNQIKSAIGNSGNFDPNDHRITASSDPIASAIASVYEGEDLWNVLTDFGPSDGGCLICANAIIAAFGGTLVRIVSQESGQAQHYGALHEGRIYDFNGTWSSGPAWIRGFAELEHFTTPCVVEQGLGDPGEIPSDPAKEVAITELLSRAVSGTGKFASKKAASDPISIKIQQALADPALAHLTEVLTDEAGPNPWQNGFCGCFAQAIADVVPGAEVYGLPIPDGREANHAVVRIGSNVYDSNGGESLKASGALPQGDLEWNLDGWLETTFGHGDDPSGLSYDELLRNVLKKHLRGVASSKQASLPHSFYVALANQGITEPLLKNLESGELRGVKGVSTNLEGIWQHTALSSIVLKMPGPGFLAENHNASPIDYRLESILANDMQGYLRLSTGQSTHTAVAHIVETAVRLAAIEYDEGKLHKVAAQWLQAQSRAGKLTVPAINDFRGLVTAARSVLKQLSAALSTSPALDADDLEAWKVVSKAVDVKGAASMVANSVARQTHEQEWLLQAPSLRIPEGTTVMVSFRSLGEPDSLESLARSLSGQHLIALALARPDFHVGLFTEFKQERLDVSKAVKEAGQEPAVAKEASVGPRRPPEVVYHGTDAEFETFRDGNFNWFTESLEDAQDYNPSRIVSARLTLSNPADLDSPKVKRLLKAKLPEVMDNGDINLFSLSEMGPEVRDVLMAAGFDGLYVERPDLQTIHWGTFRPDQVQVLDSSKTAATKAPKPILDHDSARYLKNDYAEAHLEFERDGYWFENVLQQVPLDKIEAQAPWHPEREAKNLALLQQTGAMPPVHLSLWDDGTYRISDGIHRVNAARQLGYTTVPAIVSVKRTTPPPAVAGVEERRMYRLGWDLLRKVRAQADGLDWIEVKSSTSTSFTGEVMDVQGGSWTVVGTKQGEGLVVRPEGPDGAREFHGSLDTLAKSLGAALHGGPSSVTSSLSLTADLDFSQWGDLTEWKEILEDEDFNIPVGLVEKLFQVNRLTAEWRIKGKVMLLDGEVWLYFDKKNRTFDLIKDIQQWVYDLDDLDIWDLVGDEANLYNDVFGGTLKEFREHPSEVYHWTTEENWAAIKASGALHSTTGSGLTNRSTVGIFTTADPEELADGTYGNVCIRIDLPRLLKDHPEVTLSFEPEVEECLAKEMVAGQLGVEMDNTVSPSGGMSYTTLIIGAREIPLAYLANDDDPDAQAGPRTAKLAAGPSSTTNTAGALIHETRAPLTTRRRSRLLTKKAAFTGKVYLDMDGVLADYEKGANAAGLHPKDFKEVDGAFRNLDLLPGAQEAVTKLMEMLPGRVFLLSKPSEDRWDGSCQEKREWVRQHFPEIPPEHVLLVLDKGGIGKPGDVLVDDHPEWANAEHFGGRVLRFTGPQVWKDLFRIVEEQDRRSVA